MMQNAAVNNEMNENKIAVTRIRREIFSISVDSQRLWGTDSPSFRGCFDPFEDIEVILTPLGVHDLESNPGTVLLRTAFVFPEYLCCFHEPTREV
eukprot:CAMPEP_0114517500 /NCGR_PEP_ID=MMETSP0109-20121206/17926_1 /TAXON_ID=29199 /ORGANISM="Chlorarachnion reptans, Strain CCCM449" /LENGTH=94 /DNA_ID=CAMNT_0001698023 /DNA_START=210 /DNA_END=494 /DNA_ORIENTATION=-